MRIALAMVLMVGCTQAGDAVTSELEASKIKLATLQVARLAREAYPMWAATNPGKDCPDSLEVLLEYANSKRDAADPWGAPLRMGCGTTLPAGASGLAVWSLGPDGKDGTPDDVCSWK